MIKLKCINIYSYILLNLYSSRYSSMLKTLSYKCEFVKLIHFIIFGKKIINSNYLVLVSFIRNIVKYPIIFLLTYTFCTTHPHLKIILSLSSENFYEDYRCLLFIK